MSTKVEEPSTEDPAELYYLKVRGFKISLRPPTMVLDAVWPCPQLHDHRCTIYDKRPQRCQDFPSRPSQLVGTPCTYWFERAGADGKIEYSGGDRLPEILAQIAG